MTRICHDVALCCALLILVPMPCFGADLPTETATGANSPEICFPLPDGERMLKDLEGLPICREAVKAGEEVINSNKIRAKALEDRIAEQDREIASGKKTIDDTRKAGEEAVKVAAGSWWSRALGTVKWVALGALLGLAAGVAK